MVSERCSKCLSITEMCSVYVLEPAITWFLSSHSKCVEVHRDMQMLGVANLTHCVVLFICVLFIIKWVLFKA